MPMSGRRPGAAVHGGLCAVLLAALCAAGVAAFDPKDWTLPPGFTVEAYTPGAKPVPSARSLAISGASQPNGPWITYVSAMSFDASKPQNVRRTRRPPRRPSTAPQLAAWQLQMHLHPAFCPTLIAAPAAHPPTDQRRGGPDRPWRG